ncbi:MAG: hypothetical protein CMQ41_03085 [Gammaproteobacteria bacterium]|nr:hypothetical protein [Gammaproteobacteria bacterium]
MSQNEWALFSGRQLASAYALEADAFGAIAMSPGFERYISQFDDYYNYLKRLHNDPNHRQAVVALLQNNGIIDAAVPTKELAQFFCQAQIAACSELFNGWEIGASQLNREAVRTLVEKGSEGIMNVAEIPKGTSPDQYSESQRQVLNGINVIQNVDTVRVIQVLKLLGFLSTPASETYQISLGVGNGYRDLYGIHLIPRITKKQEGDSIKFYFEAVESQAAHTVLVDNDPIYKDHFDGLNKRETDRVLALNTDADKALKELEALQQESGLNKCNLLACLRLDHRMIEGGGDFIRMVAKVIDLKADLIMTIGAGNNLEEFRGRINCFDELSRYLSQCGLAPVRILMHGKGSLAEQRSRPNFGQLGYTSYQILYCKLSRDRIV